LGVTGTGPVEIWRGGVALSDCDEMGHMNVRRYLARAQEGLGGLAAGLGLPRAFTPSATATLLVQEHRIRFLAEARVGAPLYMTGGTLAFGESDATLLQVLRHAGDDRPAAALLTRVAHAKPSDGRAFPWPARARQGAAALTVELPDFAAPRGLHPSNAAPDSATPDASTPGLQRLGRGMVMIDASDLFGRLTPEAIIGRMADATAGLMRPLRSELKARSPGLKIGGAALEYQLIYDDLPRLGDHLELWGRVTAVKSKVQHVAFTLVDPLNGRPWASARAVVSCLDLEARRLITIPDDLQSVTSDGRL
jgi:acyl-CoA thioester hydrolase